LNIIREGSGTDPLEYVAKIDAEERTSVPVARRHSLYVVPTPLQSLRHGPYMFLEVCPSRRDVNGRHGLDAGHGTKIPAPPSTVGLRILSR
jgi:hypothetical protein